jgi:hypothetical protein
MKAYFSKNRWHLHRPRQIDADKRKWSHDEPPLGQSAIWKAIRLLRRINPPGLALLSCNSF